MSERVLVVDDDPAMLRSVQRVLAGSYDVLTASESEEALELLRSAGSVRLAILDVRMKGFTGFELMSELRAVQADLDVIFMTGAVHELDDQLIRAIREKAFYFIQKPFDREVLLTLVMRCLEQRQLAEENQRYVERLENELEEARAFQQSLLPEPREEFGPVTIEGRYLPCDELGGDVFDYLDAGGGRVTSLVADVSGHGVSAAMLTAIVKAAFHDAEEDAWRPRSVVQRVAQSLRPFADDRFVTLFCVRVDLASGKAEYVNAGHPPPVLWGPERGWSSLARTGPLVSPAFPDFDWDEESIQLQPGDQLVVYTDGLTEARGGDGEFFGEEGLEAFLRSAAEPAEDLLDRLLAHVAEFETGRPADDDRTLLHLRMD